ncbi:hypothetical protein B0H11DRAFT_2234425 [Mycena galericulata]|nr:hypothetical protein B0H11DRAFT_2242026 [Mycena galericulata]KAJ7477748.1 hypothetical protein B0H11DRAFT_2234425 [Mycena galericulata]
MARHVATSWKPPAGHICPRLLVPVSVLGPVPVVVVAVVPWPPLVTVPVLILVPAPVAVVTTIPTSPRHQRDAAHPPTFAILASQSKGCLIR